MKSQKRNTTKRCRTGARKLSQYRHRRVSSRKRWRYSTRMLGGARRPDYFQICLKALSLYVKLRTRSIKEHPHLYGYSARDYYEETLKLEQQQREAQALLDKVYGPDPCGTTPRCIWSERYPELTSQNAETVKKR